MKKEKEKPKYTMGQNLIWLTKKAWQIDKQTIFVPIAVEVAALLQRITELLIVPVILSTVERRAKVSELLLVVLIFTALVVGVTGLSRFFSNMNGRAEGILRLTLDAQLNEAACKTSYPNTLDKDYIKKRSQARRSLMLGNSAARLFEDFIKVLAAVAGFGLYLLLMAKVSVWLIVITLICSVAGFYLLPNQKEANVWTYGAEEATSEYTREMGYVYDTILYDKVGKEIRLFGLGDWLMDRYNKAMEKYRSFMVKRGKKYLSAELANVLVDAVRNGIAYAYLIYLTLTSNLSASEFLLMFTAISGFGSWITIIIDTVMRMHRRSLGLCHIREFLDWPEPFLFEEGAEVECFPGKQYELCLEHVTYRYPESEEATISDMSLTIKPGEKLAIVGLNGAGKTTLVKLLCGFLDPQEGRVLLNGEDIRKFNRRQYYRLFTAVFQEFSTLEASIAANVAQSETEVDMGRVEECLKEAGIYEAVRQLPNGLMTNYGKQMHDDGIELSGGQTQRLMLARALYKNAPILVLDEPTAALDPLAEHEVYMKYNDMSAGRTSLFISHRLASTRFCDRIIFLENGGIAEEGTHEELLDKQGGYAKLFEVQSHYYKETPEHEEGQPWQK